MLGRGENWCVWIRSGALGAFWETGAHWAPESSFAGPGYATPQERIDRWHENGILPQFDFASLRKWSLLPLWMPMLLAGIPTVLLWWLDRRRAAPGHCAKCGYNLTGNVTGVCAECGAVTNGAAAT